MQNQYRIKLPAFWADNLNQDEAYFYLQIANKTRKIRFHDYGEIYKVPGLYEQLFYDRLQCHSPKIVSGILNRSVKQSRENFNQLRVLDLGAGNGIMGEALKKYGISRLVGVDIIPEAQEAVERDRPGVYDAYYVTDFCKLSKKQREEFSSWSFDCLTTVAALGFGDIPPMAFLESFNMIKDQGWIAFNIKDCFLNTKNGSPFSNMIRELLFSDYFDLFHLERYQHRLSIEGVPLFYFAITGRKKSDIPPDFINQYI